MKSSLFCFRKIKTSLLYIVNMHHRATKSRFEEVIRATVRLVIAGLQGIKVRTFQASVWL